MPEQLARDSARRQDLVAGYASVPPRSYPGFTIARYTVAGRLDRTFGQNGKVVTYFDSGRRASVSAVAIQRDGKVVAVGSSSDSPSFGRFRFALARYTPRGRLDRSFGRGGTVETDFDARSGAIADAAAIQPDGKIVAAGYVSRDSRNRCCARPLQRRRHAGSELRTGRAARPRWARALATPPASSSSRTESSSPPDGRSVSPDGNFALVRYNARRQARPELRRGRQIGGHRRRKRRAALRPRCSGMARSSRRAQQQRRQLPECALARYKGDGSLNPSFGGGGKVRTEFRHRSNGQCTRRAERTARSSPPARSAPAELRARPLQRLR